MGNQNSGRKPKPKALHLLNGNPSKKRFLEHEVVPPKGDVVKPDDLSGPASKLWDSMAPVCLYMGTLTPGDVRPFAAMCELQATLIEASSQKDAPGFAMFTLSHDFDGAPKVGVHASVRVERETANSLRPYYEYFGMTPSSRARISVPKQDEPVSKWAGALK